MAEMPSPVSQPMESVLWFPVQCREISWSCAHVISTACMHASKGCAVRKYNKIYFFLCRLHQPRVFLGTRHKRYHPTKPSSSCMR